MQHLDNTEDFKESREEVMQSQRRRQSSFPPADGDEAAILLEKANIIRLQKVHQDALSIQGRKQDGSPYLFPHQRLLGARKGCCAINIGNLRIWDNHMTAFFA